MAGGPSQPAIDHNLMERLTASARYAETKSASGIQSPRSRCWMKVRSGMPKIRLIAKPVVEKTSVLNQTRPITDRSATAPRWSADSNTIWPTAPCAAAGKMSTSSCLSTTRRCWRPTLLARRPKTVRTPSISGSSATSRLKASMPASERERAEARGDHHGDADIERCRHGIEESRDEGVMCCGDQLMRHRRWQAGGELQLGSAAAKLVTTLEGGAETGYEAGPQLLWQVL